MFQPKSEARTTGSRDAKVGQDFRIWEIFALKLNVLEDAKTMNPLPVMSTRVFPRTISWQVAKIKTQETGSTTKIFDSRPYQSSKQRLFCLYVITVFILCR